VIRMASCNDFLSHQAPMRNRSLRVRVIVHPITHKACFTLYGVVCITRQPEPGRTSTESNCLRMHFDDYPPAAQEKHCAPEQTCQREPSSVGGLEWRPQQKLGSLAATASLARFAAFFTSADCWDFLRDLPPDISAASRRASAFDVGPGRPNALFLRRVNPDRAPVLSS